MKKLQLELRLNKDSFAGLKGRQLADVLRELADDIEYPADTYEEGQIEEAVIVLNIGAENLVDACLV